jgi:hypothetical protein
MLCRTGILFRFHTVFKIVDAVLVGTMCTAEKDTVHLHAMTKDTASAVGTGGRQGMDGTFKAIEYMRFTILAHFKAFVILVSAHLANSQSAVARKISKLIFFGFHY